MYVCIIIANYERQKRAVPDIDTSRSIHMGSGNATEHNATQHNATQYNAWAPCVVLRCVAAL